MYLFILDNS